MYIQYTLMAESKVNARLLFLNHLPKIDPFRSGQLPDVGCDSKLQKDHAKRDISGLKTPLLPTWQA